DLAVLKDGREAKQLLQQRNEDLERQATELKDLVLKLQEQLALARHPKPSVVAADSPNRCTLCGVLPVQTGGPTLGKAAVAAATAAAAAPKSSS
ncbi:MAG: hypothetical protein ACK4UX_13420, partial [Thiobacillus sp.]